MRWINDLFSSAYICCLPVRKGHFPGPLCTIPILSRLTFSELAVLSSPVPEDSWCVLSVYCFCSLVGWYLITYQLLTGVLDFEAFQCPKVFKADDIPTPVLPGRVVSALECVVKRSLGLLNVKCGWEERNLLAVPVVEISLLFFSISMSL